MLSNKKFKIKNFHLVLKRLILIDIGLFILSILFIAFTNGYLLVPKPIRDFVIAYENGIQDQYTEIRRLKDMVDRYRRKLYTDKVNQANAEKTLAEYMGDSVDN